MVAIPAFDVEVWMDTYEVDAEYNIAETCCDSISIQDLLRLAEKDPVNIAGNEIFTSRQTYGHIPGSPGLRQAIADLYEPSSGISQDSVVVTQGAIAANFLLLFSLCKPGDHVVAIDPTYQQLHELPVSFGADLSRWKLEEAQGWVPDVQALASLLTPRTTLLILNSPNNPTGQLISTSTLEEIIRLVREKAAPGCVIHCDEVYRPIFHGDEEWPKSIVELGYPHAVSTCSVSKAYSLAGLRVGWIASTDPNIVKAAALRRDYNIISVSTIDDHFATLALSAPARKKIIERNISLARTNKEIVDDWISKNGDLFRWATPNSGTTGLVALPKGIDDEQFCADLHRDHKVILVPAGRCFGLPGFVRLGYLCETSTLREGLRLLAEYARTYPRR